YRKIYKEKAVAYIGLHDGQLKAFPLFLQLHRTTLETFDQIAITHNTDPHTAVGFHIVGAYIQNKNRIPQAVAITGAYYCCTLHPIFFPRSFFALDLQTRTFFMNQVQHTLHNLVDPKLRTWKSERYFSELWRMFHEPIRADEGDRQILPFPELT